MFCKKCGTQLNENANFCAVCGTPVGANLNQAQPAQQAEPFAQAQPAVQQADPFAQAQPVAQQADPFTQAQPAAQQAEPFAQAQPAAQQWNPTMKPKKSKTPLILGLVGAVLALVIVLVVVLLFACSSGKGADSPQEAVDTYFKALNEKDFNDLKSIAYPAVFNKLYDEDLYDKDEYIQAIFESVGPVSRAEDMDSVVFGASKITSKDSVAASNIKQYNSSLKNVDGYVKIEKAVEIEGQVSIKVDGEKGTYKYSAVVLLADGKWYIGSIEVRTYKMDEE